MKPWPRIAIGLFLWLMCLPEARADFAHIVSQCNATLDNTNVTTTAVNTTGANFFVLSLASLETTPSGTISDSRGFAWTPLTAHGRNKLYYAFNSTGGTSHTFTYTGTIAAFPSLCVTSFSGGPVSDPFVQENGATATGATTLQTGAAASTDSGSVLITGIQFEAVNTMSINSTFTIGAQVNYVGGTNYGGGIAYRVVNSSQNPTWSWSTSTDAAAGIAAFTPTPSAAGCTGTAPTLTAATWDNITSCHSLATNGTTITVTPGTYSTSTEQTITKYVNIVATSVILTDNTDDAEDMLDITLSSVGNTSLTGVSITQGAANLNRTAPNGVIRLRDNGSSTGKPFLLSGTTYTATNGLYIYGSTPKVVAWLNTMSAVPSGGSCFNNSAFYRLDGGLAWSSASTNGSLDTSGENNAYFERNTLTNVMEGIDSNTDGRIVTRFNTLTNSGFVAHDTTSTGSRQYEFYGNTVVYDQVTGACGGDPPNITGVFQFRMGTGIIHSNVIPDITSASWGDKNEMTLEGANLRRAIGSWPCWNVISQIGAGVPAPRQPGWGYITGATSPGTTGVTQDRQPIYYVNNTGAGNYTNPTPTDYSDAAGDSCVTVYGAGSYESSTTYIVSDREFYKQVALGSFDGTTGASQGTRAARPASTTNGVGYWATDAGGNWKLKNADGTDNADANDGCLDVVVGGAWSNCVYTPKQFPHPLIFTPPAGTNFGSRLRLR